MKTLLIVSWRNVWRNKSRSITILLAIAFGLWGGIFSSSLSAGMMKQRFYNSIEKQISHIQIHDPRFTRDDDIRFSIADAPAIIKTLRSDSVVKTFSARTCCNGMIATATLTKGIRIYGINPAQENLTTQLAHAVIDGHYLSVTGRNPVLVGKQLADKMKLNPGSRVILTFTDCHGEIISASFRVEGILRTSNSMLDETQVYIRQTDLQQLAGFRAVNEIAILLNNINQVNAFADHLRSKFPDEEIRTWGQISPDLLYMNEMAGVTLMVLMVIIMLALAFGLLNTMLMTVFERTRELGMLMAIGMNKSKLFTMILLETTYITVSGSLAGMLLSGVTILLTSRHGIDFSSVGGDSLSEYGYDAIVYPTLYPEFFVNIIILVLITSFVSAVYPALKALRLKPSEAIRKD